MSKNSLYILNINEQASNIHKNYGFMNFTYKPITCNLKKNIIKLDKNDIYIYNDLLKLEYKGKLNMNESNFSTNVKLVYNLEASLSFIGGIFILENERGTIIYNGSGLPYIAAYRGSIAQVKNRYDI
jgi:hypothetical protein